MNNSNQAVLEYLSKWMEKRFRKAYTEEDSKKVASISLEKLKEFDPQISVEEQRSIFYGYSPENMSKTYASFPRMYSCLEQKMKESISSQKVQETTSRREQENTESYKRCCEKMVSLVDKLRERFEDVFPEELSSKDFEIAFLEVFPNPQDYPEYMDERNRFFLLDLKFRAERDPVPKFAYLQQSSIYEASREIYKEIFSKMVADLYQKGERK